jgi:hypothetical protein
MTIKNKQGEVIRKGSRIHVMKRGVIKQSGTVAKIAASGVYVDIGVGLSIHPLNGDFKLQES